MLFIVVVAAILGALPIGGTADHELDGSSKTDYPRLIRAEMPLYPPLARTAQISGTVEIQVTVERGSVIEVLVKSSSSPLLANATITNMKTWQFELGDRATFTVKYVYEIKGRPTLKPENPRLELDLPKAVKIRARPFKPTRT